MTYQVAVASLDGVRINQHFGRAERFLIYQIDGSGQAACIEEREVKRACGYGSHEEDSLLASAAALADCSFALVARIGPGAEKILAKQGVKAFEIADSIPNALEKLVRYLDRVRERT
ncbi:NifB/NifX family molybdenum-iron cluster-binding protein [Gorillibacterium timonense]|uniref:NifB/NifX family molybdenum-iron cluster-binding protein n=1 Tax=Gorillibacterium timonense TaxID=1689269 RepID=UPI00071C23E7|nr:NifB/NifX family molybdenum-iron cluster-binding protein [Gorillibacterium timonense]